MKRNEKYFKGLTRRDYIAKANEIIHREGIGAVTIRRIAKEMDCSTASLYRYFDSRDELLYLFFENNNNKLRVSIREYYKMFPENLMLSNRVFHEMLQTGDFMGRDFEMCRKCIRSNAIGYDNAVSLNRMVCLLFKGYFKTVCDDGIEEKDVNGRVRLFIRDIEKLVRMFAKDLKGYKEYQIQ